MVGSEVGEKPVCTYSRHVDTGTLTSSVVVVVALCGVNQSKGCCGKYCKVNM